MKRLLISIFVSALLQAEGLYGNTPAGTKPAAPPAIPAAAKPAAAPAGRNLSITPPSETELLRLSAGATVARFPDADSCVLWDFTDSRYDLKGLGTESSESFTKILNEKGVRQYRTLSFGFNTNYGTVGVKKLEVIRPDGKRIVIDPEKNSKIAISPGQMGSNIYDPAQKTLSVTVPGLDVGDIVAVKVLRTTEKARIPGMWSAYEMLQYDMPILRCAVRVNAPAALPLRSIAVKDAVKGGVIRKTEEKQGDRIVYSWETENVPQIIPEPGMPELYSCAQRLLLSTAPDWESVSEWYAGLCRPALDATDAEIKGEVAKLIAGKKNDLEKVQAIFQFVSQKIRYMGITPEKEAPGYEPHPVKLTFHNRYGVCRDKAALLASMLELAGFKAYPALFMAGPRKDGEVPNEYFNHAVVAWEKEPGKYELLDPTYESTAELFPATQMDMSYLVAKPGGEKLLRSPVVPPEKNMMTISTTGKIAPGGEFHGRSVLDFSGVNDLFYREALSRWPEELKKQYFARQLRKIFPGVDLDRIQIVPENIRDMGTALKITLDYTVPSALLENSREYLLLLPQLADHFGAAAFLLGGLELTERKLPLTVDSTCMVSEKFRIELPHTLRIMALPSAREFTVPGILSRKWSCSRDGNIISGSSELKLSSLEIAPADYAQLRRAFGRIKTALRELPIVKTDFLTVNEKDLKTAFPKADSLLLNSRTHIRVEDESAWERTDETERKILTYAGVKDHSEIKIPYQPKWEKVSVSARVVSPSGKTATLSPSEIHIMDAAWNAGAPRYPGGKILVATLPGVEPGSTIHLKTVRHRSRRLFFAETMVLGGSDAPSVLREYTLDAPSSLRLKCSTTPPGTIYSETHSGERTIRKWLLKDAPRLKQEIGAPPAWIHTPVILSSSGEFSAYGKSIAATLEAKAAAVTPGLKKFIAERKWAALPDQEAKITAVRDYVDKFIRPAGPEWGSIPLSALAPTPEVTLQSGYGNSADRAILTAALLKELGIESRFVLGSGLGYAPVPVKLLNQAPNPELFLDRVLLYLPSLQYYLNDSGRYAPLGASGSEGATALDLHSGRLLPIQPRLQRETETRINYQIVCKGDDSATLTVTSELYGNAFAAVNRTLSEATPEIRKRYFDALATAISPEAFIVGIPESDFRNYPGQLRYRIEVPGFLVRTGNYRSFQLPGFGKFGGAVRTADSKRTVPYWRNSAVRLRINYSIALPPNFKVTPGRPERSEIGAYGSALFQENFYNEGARLRIDCRMSLPVELVAPQDYCELSNMQRELDRLSTNRIIIAPDLPAPQRK